MIELLLILAELNQHDYGHDNRKQIEPLPGRTWKECYTYCKDVKWHILNYHVSGDKSCKGEHIEEVELI